MAELLVVINGEPIAVHAHNLRTVGSCVGEAFARSSQRQLSGAHYLVRNKDGEDLSSKDRVDYTDRIFVTLDAPQRDPGDETDYRDEPSAITSVAIVPASGHLHAFDDLTDICACGATHEQLRRH